ncbi:uncharacterized protein LOC110266639 [Arachis ipaensis]|uniref:uncharacterized protein LOC110266639 n=1 Tax=Arachis ipaensis TaxID=130454 RepID=UPI000A2B651E|nr:uncharacterized protein LOC110266639 [Arachis ipaensis]
MDVPCVQDRVFYFPQGHIELLPEPTEQHLRQMKNQKSPKYNLPSKILCRVIDVKCLVMFIFFWFLMLCYVFLIGNVYLIILSPDFCESTSSFKWHFQTCATDLLYQFQYDNA